jgi:AcrR family transcriptional regulator
MAKVGERAAQAGRGSSTSTDARHRILDAAETEFASHGFDATPTARIAGAAGVPKGLLFYYFPKKIDVLLTLLAERLPEHPLCHAADVVRPGDVAGSLLRLARRLKLGEHRSDVLRTIIHREASTHPEVRDHISALRGHLLSLTEEVMDGSSPHRLSPRRRRKAAQTYVAVMIADANARQLGAPTFDMAGTAEIIADGLLAARAPSGPSHS